MILENKNILIITIVSIVIVLYTTFYISKTYNKDECIKKENYEPQKYTSPAYINLVNEFSDTTNYFLIIRILDENEKKEVIEMKTNNNIFFLYSGLSDKSLFTSIDKENISFYSNLCIGWFHHFRQETLEHSIINQIPNALISHTDYIDYNKYEYNNLESYPDKEYDFIFIYQDTSHNESVYICISEYIDILCKTNNLNGLLIKETNCVVKCYENNSVRCPNTCHEICITNFDLENESNITKLLNYYKKCRFIVLPELLETNQHILTLALTMNIPCLFNKNIIGGWKYITPQTGLEFDNLTDFSTKLEDFMKNYGSFEPRKYILENYGKENEFKKNTINKFITHVIPDIELTDILMIGN